MSMILAQNERLVYTLHMRINNKNLIFFIVVFGPQTAILY